MIVNGQSGYSAKAALCNLYKRKHEEGDYPPNNALKMFPRMVTKRLQVDCQARRTDQQPPDQIPTADFNVAYQVELQQIYRYDFIYHFVVRALCNASRSFDVNFGIVHSQYRPHFVSCMQKHLHTS
ncbi:hypothetical protein CSKR_202660 [Clonorchis sinensis]|uniref:Uncharacterized protein n=1 Tax=Clonorchis sinensis TaxID=79923 RepID=A0A8T1M1K1_CLOSI|nr:hypothetical protein CSKR_202660 [Clonorchis sinensis]